MFKVQDSEASKAQEGVVDMGERPTTLGAQCTGDHLTGQRGLDSEEDAEFEGASPALVLCDRGTDWLGCYPAATMSLDNTVEAFKQWAGLKEKGHNPFTAAMRTN